MNRMKMLAALAVAALASDALACSKPATATLAGLMREASYTRVVGGRGGAIRPTVVVKIRLPGIGDTLEAWKCLTWNVRIALPPGASMAAGDDGEAEPSEQTGLASDATATFNVRIPDRPHGSDKTQLRAWLVVKVRFPSDDADVFLVNNDDGGSHVWRYPVDILTH